MWASVAKQDISCVFGLHRGEHIGREEGLCCTRHGNSLVTCFLELKRAGQCRTSASTYDIGCGPRGRSVSEEIQASIQIHSDSREKVPVTRDRNLTAPSRIITGNGSKGVKVKKTGEGSR